MPSIYSLPNSVRLQILRFLTWDEKLFLSRAIQEWQDILSSKTAWHHLEYDYDTVPDDSDVDGFGGKFIDCVGKYGVNFKNIKLAFTLEKPALILNILREISRKCKNLSTLELELFCLNNKNTFEDVYFQTFSLTVCELFHNCQNLKAVKINPVSVSQYDDKPLETLLSMIIGKSQAHKIVEVDLFLVSPYGNFDYKYNLLSFENLQKLAIRLEHLSAETLLVLVGKSLANVSLYADDESDTNNDELQDDVWKTVLSKQPLFQVELELRQRQVTFADFPHLMPLTKIALTFFRTEIKLDQLIKYFIDNYSKNLTVFNFIFDDSGEDEELKLNDETEQVSDALIHMVRECPKLQHLKYSLPITSWVILCIAKEKRLKEMCFYENKIYYIDKDQHSQDDNVKYLATDKITLEENVSLIMNKKWTLTPDEEFEILNH